MMTPIWLEAALSPQGIQSLLQLLIPGLLLLGMAYLVFTRLQESATERTEQELRQKAHSTLLPLRVTAYERFSLYLARLHPTQLASRNQGNAKRLTAKEMAEVLQTEIREELEYNRVQALYISEESWNAVFAATRTVEKLLDEALDRIGPKQPATLYLAALVEAMRTLEGEFATERAARVLRRDVLAYYDTDHTPEPAGLKMPWQK
jgi:hypothetical protein